MMNNNSLNLNFTKDQLEQVPLPHKRGGGKASSKLITLSKSKIYFSSIVCKELGLKLNDSCDLRMSPNNQGFMIFLGDRGFYFTSGGYGKNSKTPEVSALTINGKDAVEFLKGRFKTTKFDYRKMGGDIIYVFPHKEGSDGK